MRRVLLIALFVLLIAPLRAEDATVSRADQSAIRGVITRQMEAFGRDDAAAAFGFAAPGIQGAFGSADNFLAMVRKGYPPVYRPHAVEFAALSRQDAGVMQDVELIGPDGLAYTARYTLEQGADGTWRISGCSLMASHRLGV